MPTTVKFAFPKPPDLPPALPPIPVRRFSVDEYHRIIQAGVLQHDERVELIHGWITPVWPDGPTGSSVIRRLDRLLQRSIRDAAVVSVGQPITTLDSQFAPAVAVCRGPESRYFSTHPEPDDISFVVDVVDSGLMSNLAERISVYARYRIGCCWVVHIENRQVEVYTQPTGKTRGRYQQQANYGVRESVPVLIGDTPCRKIPVSELLP